MGCPCFRWFPRVPWSVDFTLAVGVELRELAMLRRESWTVVRSAEDAEPQKGIARDDEQREEGEAAGLAGLLALQIGGLGRLGRSAECRTHGSDFLMRVKKRVVKRFASHGTFERQRMHWNDFELIPELNVGGWGRMQSFAPYARR